MCITDLRNVFAKVFLLGKPYNT